MDSHGVHVKLVQLKLVLKKDVVEAFPLLPIKRLCGLLQMGQLGV